MFLCGFIHGLTIDKALTTSDDDLTLNSFFFWASVEMAGLTLITSLHYAIAFNCKLVIFLYSSSIFQISKQNRFNIL